MGYSNYPKAVRNNARRGQELNKKVGGRCATSVGKQTARILAAGAPLSRSRVRRMHSYLQRAETYYDPSDTKACGTISYLLWGGLAGKRWAEAEFNKMEKEDGQKRAKAPISGSTKKALQNKVKEHNEQVTAATKKATLPMLSKVYRRGVGAYKTNPGSVRPSVSSPEQWALARCNSFLYALKNERFRGGKHDTDLFPKGHKLRSNADEKNRFETAGYL